MLDLIGFKSWLDVEDFSRLLVRLLFDLLVTAVLIHGIYRRRHGRTEYVFTYYALNLVTFAICFLLRKVPTDLGFALGLFAVFGVLRYRTETIGIRELTYLFLVIGVAVVDAAANKKVSVAELLLVNGAIVGLVYALERVPGGRVERARRVTYDEVSRLRAGEEEALRRDLSERLGVEVTRVEVLRADLLRDTAELMVYYLEPQQERAS